MAAAAREVHVTEVVELGNLEQVEMMRLHLHLHLPGVVREVHVVAQAYWSDKTHPPSQDHDAQGIAAHLVSLLHPQHR